MKKSVEHFENKQSEKEETSFVRSAKCSIKFSNACKIENVKTLTEEYGKVLNGFIVMLWDLRETKIPSLIPKEITDKVKENTWLSARMIQCAAKQASGVVRGTLTKQNKRIKKYESLRKQNLMKNARKLYRKIQDVNSSCPIVNNVSMELDSRFISINLENNTVFDMWVNITSIGNGMKITIPVKKTKHFNKMFGQGKMKCGIRLNNKDITFMFEIEKPELKTNGNTIGVDIGVKSVFACSNGQISTVDKHGWDLDKIHNLFTFKKKGSKQYKKVQELRKNYINWCLNQLNLKDVKSLRAENIKNLRFGKRTSSKLSRFVYTLFFDKLKRMCEENGVHFLQIDPTYTSQRCKCGWVQKSNRKGKLFKCRSCGYAADSDLNASHNISLELPEIPKEVRRKQLNRRGFYWLAEGQEPIVPYALKVTFGGLVEK